MNDVTLLVVYHKEAPLVSGGDFLAVNAGRAVATDREWLENNTVGDDTGDNISEKNPTYNELTAVYWAWKNLSSAYYGLCHYRRFFRWEDNGKIFTSYKRVGEDFAEKTKYSPETVRRLLREYDFIAPKPMRRKSVYEHYASAHDARDLDAAGEAIKRLFPEYADAFERYIRGTDSYFYNMFVFDSATFDRYCRFVFGVLRELEPRFAGKRMFVSERLTGAFIVKLIEEGKKGAFLPIVCVDEKPRFREAVKATKKNLKTRTEKGLRSLVYAYKPLLLWGLPAFVFRAYRNRK